MMHINTLVTTAVTVQHRLGGSSTHWVILMEQMQCMVAKFAGSFSRSSELGAISAPCRRPALWRRRQFPQKPSQSWSTPPQIWAVSQPFCPPRENATQPGFPIFLRPQIWHVDLCSLLLWRTKRIDHAPRRRRELSSSRARGASV